MGSFVRDLASPPAVGRRRALSAHCRSTTNPRYAALLNPPRSPSRSPPRVHGTRRARIVPTLPQPSLDHPTFPNDFPNDFQERLRSSLGVQVTSQWSGLRRWRLARWRSWARRSDGRQGVYQESSQTMADMAPSDSSPGGRHRTRRRQFPPNPGKKCLTTFASLGRGRRA